MDLRKGCGVLCARARAQVGQHLALPSKCFEEDEASPAHAIAKRLVVYKLQIHLQQYLSRSGDYDVHIRWPREVRYHAHVGDAY